jgi:nitrite reductase/ring-hydroxylating ferredoxin subunit
MPQILVGRTDDLRDGAVIIVSTPEAEIGVFRNGVNLYAYENVCIHQGGPVCEGMRVPKIEDVIAPDKTLLGQKFDESEMHIVCPWHGYEFKLETGECIGEPQSRLRQFEVAERNGEIYVVV